MLKIFLCLHPSVYLLVSWAWWDWPLTWLSNIVLQCYDTVGWVMWPVKSSLKWPIMCRGDVKLYYTIPYQLSDQAKLLNDSIFVPPAAIYSLFYSFSLIRTAVAPSLSLDQRHGTSSKTICVSRTCKLTVFIVHWRHFFLNSTRHIEHIRGIFCGNALYKWIFYIYITSQTTWTVTPPVCCQSLNPTSPFIIITQPESWYSFYHPTEGRRLSRLTVVLT